MPLVFVHGVNVRRGSTAAEHKAFDDRVRARDELLRSVAMRGLVAPPAVQHIENPYWGDDGANFTYDLVSVPADGTELFGQGPAPQMEQILMETVPLDVAMAARDNAGDVAPVLLTLARQRSLAHAIDALVAATAVSEIDTSIDTEETQARDLAAFASRALAYAASNPDLSWLTAINPATNEPRLVNDDGFLDALTAKVGAFTGPAAPTEHFGGPGFLNRLKATAQGIAQVARRTFDAVVGAAGGAAAGVALGFTPGTAARLLRPLATRRGGVFVGDIFAYLAKRTKIAGIVTTALDAAIARKTPQDDKLIVVCHSMGGNIVYDILTSTRPDIQVDLFVTVGSQVALFKELRLYVEDQTTPSIAPKKVKKPANIKAWLNVFDPMDVLGFAAEGVFEDVKDFAVSNQGTVLDAHVLYFVRPVFHERLRARMAALGLGS